MQAKTEDGVFRERVLRFFEVERVVVGFVRLLRQAQYRSAQDGRKEVRFFGLIKGAGMGLYGRKLKTRLNR